MHLWYNLIKVLFNSVTRNIDECIHGASVIIFLRKLEGIRRMVFMKLWALLVVGWPRAVAAGEDMCARRCWLINLILVYSS
jgi:hypothetical protein